MKSLPHTRSCFVCGEFNPIGLKLRFETDGRIVQTRFTPGSEHAGFRQTVHGGLLATLLDEAMVWGCAVQTKSFGFCAEMNVRYVNPARPGEELTVLGELVSNRRGKIFEAKGEIRNHAGLVLATSTGKYMPVKDVPISDMVTDFIGDPSSVFGEKAG